MSGPTFVAAADELELEPWPLEPDQIVAGTPAVSGLILDQDDLVERKVFQVTRS